LRKRVCIHQFLCANVFRTITVNDVQPARAGVRAQAIDFDGNMVDDFKIMKHNNNIHVLNAPSPAATSCLAIADEIVSVVIN
jgi:L-2-hydroxyglutarate oxidase